MHKSSCPKCLWDYCCLLVTKIKNISANNYYAAKGRIPHEIVSGETPDISEYATFSWYQPVWYMNPSLYPMDNKHLGQWIGVSHRVGQAMCFWILAETGRVLSRSSVQALSPDELLDNNIKNMLHRYDLSVDHHIGDNNVSIKLKVPKNCTYIQDEDDLYSKPFDPSVEPLDDNDIPINAYDQLLNLK